MNTWNKLASLDTEIEEAIVADKPIPSQTLQQASKALNSGAALFGVGRFLAGGDFFLDRMTSKLAEAGEEYSPDLMAFAKAQATDLNRETVLRNVLQAYRYQGAADRETTRPVINFLSERVNLQHISYAEPAGYRSGTNTFQATLEYWGLPVPQSDRFGGVDFGKALLHPIRSLRGDYREPVAGK